MSKFLHYQDGCHGYYFRPEDVSLVSTKGTIGKPAGWLDDVAAVVTIRNPYPVYLELNAEGFERFKRLIELESVEV